MTSHARTPARNEEERTSLVLSIPFFAVHALALATPFLFAPTWSLVGWCVALYVVRMFGVTAGYHRYFSHRAFKTSRWFQFVLAFLAETSIQKGVLWWAAHHRHHHRHSDDELDIHSPVQRGFWWSHVGWIVCTKYDETRMDAVKDLARFPELRLLNRFHLVPPVLLGVALWAIGGWAVLFWGFFLSTTLLWHGTFFINSLAHVLGSRRYQTTDDSRNSLVLALLTLGEGWHNNHHHYMSSANQGFFWWEIDLTWYALKALSWVGIVHDLRAPPASALKAHLVPAPATAASKNDDREDMTSSLRPPRIVGG